MAPRSLRPVRRALLSVSDKSGLVAFGSGLAELGIELIASGGTANELRDAGLEVIDVAELTGSPEMLGGRVKTLHPRIHGGILARRDHEGDQRDLADQEIGTIDLVVVNLYPFEATVAKADVTLAEAIEKIDIGGPSMIRSAAKNWAYVAVVVDPADYGPVLEEIRDAQGLGDSTRRGLALKAFERTAEYDAAISDFLARAKGSEDGAAAEPTSEGSVFPPQLRVELQRAATLRYGENPHQRAALYGSFLEVAEPLHGKELSYNNVVDLQAALGLIIEFDAEDAAAVAILKHNTPCGVGSAENPLEAYRRAFATDPESPFGGIIASNRCVDLRLAQEIDKIFSEVVVAPAFDADALALLTQRKNRRLLRFHPDRIDAHQLDWRRVFGGVLLQEPDFAMEQMASCRVATRRKPTEDELSALGFSWKVAKHAKSNAVVFGTLDRTLALGAGATSRVDAIHQAAAKAQRVGLDLAGSVLASDAFFPFPDGIEAAVEAGASAIVQPGGSVRDDKVIAAADELGIAMVLSGARHFRH
jgi:phosphoribosylaminoimidazolecarboxamide formyltransferase/IMP cyclohydrolase